MLIQSMTFLHVFKDKKILLNIHFTFKQSLRLRVKYRSDFGQSFEGNERGCKARYTPFMTFQFARTVGYLRCGSPSSLWNQLAFGR